MTVPAIRRSPAACATLSLLTAASLQFAPAPASAQDKALVSRTHEITETAVVKSVDVATRHLVLTNGAGETETVKVAPQFKRLDSLKPGDRITATYRAELELMLSAPNAPLPQDAAGTVAARAGQGSAPGVAVANYMMVTGAVLKIDMANHTLTIVSPKGGEVHNIEVTREEGRKAMSRLKVGDKITAYVTESLLLDVKPS